jgi:hypothetical protein
MENGAFKVFGTRLGRWQVVNAIPSPLQGEREK